MASLKHPESVVLGEEVVLEVHLFNNQDKEARVSFKLHLMKTETNPTLHHLTMFVGSIDCERTSWNAKHGRKGN